MKTKIELMKKIDATYVDSLKRWIKTPGPLLSLESKTI